MNKKCLFLFLLFVVQSKSDDGDFLRYFSDFAESFFKNVTEIEHADASVPGFQQVRDVELKTIEELTKSLQDELFKQLQSQVPKDAIVVTDNPKTKIYVKTFSHYFEDVFHPDDTDNDEISPDSDNVNPLEADALAFLNQFPKNIDILNIYNEENQTSVDKGKEINIESRSSIDQTNTDEEKTTVVEDTSTITSVTDSDEQVTENHLFTTQTNKEVVEELKGELTTSTEKEQVINQTDLEITNTYKQNKTSNIREQKNKEVDEPKSELVTNTEKEQVINQTHLEITDTNKNNKTSNLREQKNKIALTEKQFEKDIRENIIETDDNDYDVEDATDYPQIDYIDLYKDTTNEENVYVTDRPNTIDIKDEIVENVEEFSLEIVALDNDNSTNICHGNTSDVTNIYPWISTIFIKNDTSNQFQYTCDGALISAKLLLTAARCMIVNNSTVMPDDVLVFLGKTSLQHIGVDEKNVRISQIKIHSNFSIEGGQVNNDLALLVLEEPVAFSDSIRPACLGGEGEEGISATTSWNLSGELKPVFFEKNNDGCQRPKENGTFCATYGNAVALCPSHGGLHASQRASRWYLQGIRSDDPGFRGVCFDKTVHYTSVAEHLDWIMENME